MADEFKTLVLGLLPIIVSSFLLHKSKVDLLYCTLPGPVYLVGMAASCR